MPCDALNSGAMNERLGHDTPDPAAGSSLEHPRGAILPRRPGLGLRLLGWTLLTASVGLVSCQSLFVV